MIQFSDQQTGFVLKNRNEVRKWIKSIVGNEKKLAGDLAFVFCNDEYLLELNKRYVHHSTYTDIITFDYCEGELVSGDIFISIERVRENAAKYAKSVDEEVGRVMAHGILHLLGFKDKSPEDIALMRSKEEWCLKTYPNL